MLRADATVAISRDDASPIGRVLDDKYRLDAWLGEGGMGTVYRATHLLIDRPVAIKVLNANLVADAAAQERFRREARAAGRLRHPNAVAITDFGQTADKTVYIVMELLEGRSLRDVLDGGAPVDPARGLPLMLQTAAAVAAAHEAGIIHRDLKPANIFIVEDSSSSPVVKVLDFGIAKLATEASENGQAKALTETGMMIGTPRYMSPEQCDGAGLTPASDVYSLGIILYEMLTGSAPFNGATPLAVALKQSAQIPRPPREIVPTIPQALEDVVLHALQKNPADRPADAAAFYQELYRAAEQLNLQPAVGLDALLNPTQNSSASDTTSADFSTDSERPGGQTSRSSTGKTLAASVTVKGENGRTEKTLAATVMDRLVSRIPKATRLRILLDQQPTWRALLREKRVMVGSVIVALVLIFTVGALVSLRSTSRTAAPVAENSNESVGRSLSPPAPTSASNDAQQASAEPTPPQREPQTAGEFDGLGAYYFSTGNYDAAIRAYERALQLQPDFPEAHNRLGRILMQKGQFARAADEFREAIKQRGGAYPESQYNLGFVLQRQGDAANALAAYNDAINSRDGTYPDAYYQTGIILLNLRRLPEATDALRKAIEQNGGRDAEAYLALGTALARQKNYEEAEPAFRSAIEQQDGNFPDAHYNLGLLYESTGQFADAVREYELYLQQRPAAFNRRVVEKVLRDLRRRVAREDRAREGDVQ
ncbi:MAG: protein kinase [Pyrinomonadaceae bacterium]|nr:protein kinase [Pyrinomonadaceae bacterium]